MADLIDDEILKEFVTETKGLVTKMRENLTLAEESYKNISNLETYGLLVDRIMGGSKSLAIGFQNAYHPMHKIADYAGICKAVGYKAAQIKNNEDFYRICVALLFDATDVLDEMVDLIARKQLIDVKESVSKTLIDRVRWVSEKFSSDTRESVAIGKPGKVNLGQDEIDALIEKLGFS